MWWWWIEEGAGSCRSRASILSRRSHAAGHCRSHGTAECAVIRIGAWRVRNATVIYGFDIWGRVMCFSSGSSKAPPPSQPTRFEYLPTSRTQQQKASQASDAAAASSYGSELGTPTSAPTTQSATGNSGVM